MNTITKIKKRDGRIVDFDRDKIADAIFKAAQVLGGRDKDMAEELAIEVEAYLCDKYADIRGVYDPCKLRITDTRFFTR